MFDILHIDSLGLSKFFRPLKTHHCCRARTHGMGNSWTPNEPIAWPVKRSQTNRQAAKLARGGDSWDGWRAGEFFFQAKLIRGVWLAEKPDDF